VRVVSLSENSGFAQPVPMAMQALAKESRTGIEPRRAEAAGQYFDDFRIAVIAETAAREPCRAASLQRWTALTQPPSRDQIHDR
jgi:hypothetical protein